MILLDTALLTTLRELRAQWQLRLQGNEITNPATRARIELTIDRITDFIAEIEGA